MVCHVGGTELHRTYVLTSLFLIHFGNPDTENRYSFSFKPNPFESGNRWWRFVSALIRLQSQTTADIVQYTECPFSISQQLIYLQQNTNNSSIHEPGTTHFFSRISKWSVSFDSHLSNQLNPSLYSHFDFNLSAHKFCVQPSFRCYHCYAGILSCCENFYQTTQHHRIVFCVPSANIYTSARKTEKHAATIFPTEHPQKTFLHAIPCQCPSVWTWPYM